MFPNASIIFADGITNTNGPSLLLHSIQLCFISLRTILKETDFDLMQYAVDLFLIV
jgi:hypothetical protein